MGRAALNDSRITRSGRSGRQSASRSGSGRRFGNLLRRRESLPPKKKLSYLEAREYSGIEERVAEAERVLDEKRTNAEDPAIASDATALMNAHAELEAAQQEVDEFTPAGRNLRRSSRRGVGVTFSH